MPAPSISISSEIVDRTRRVAQPAGRIAAALAGAEDPHALDHRCQHPIERLRALSDANEALARRQRLETRLTLLELEAARAPAVVPPDGRPLASPEIERANREDAQRRGRTMREGILEIDAWLDRPTP